MDVCGMFLHVVYVCVCVLSMHDNGMAITAHISGQKSEIQLMCFRRVKEGCHITLFLAWGPQVTHTHMHIQTHTHKHAGTV